MIRARYTVLDLLPNGGLLFITGPGLHVSGACPTREHCGFGVRQGAYLARNLMRVLLRDTSTGLYFQEPENWTTETDKAQTFRHSAEAMNLARKKCVEHAEVVLAFEEPDYTVALPLPAGTGQESFSRFSHLH